MPKVVLCMPVFNESKIIEEVVRDYLGCLRGHDGVLVVLDDQSTDATWKILENLKLVYGIELVIDRNPVNLGHGKTLVRALQLGLSLQSQVIVSCDGDGPLSPNSLTELLGNMNSNEIIEVNRLGRKEPKYRQLVSFATRLLVFQKTLKYPKDANSPIRMYSSRLLKEILPMIKDSPTPNLLVSIILRQKKIEFKSINAEVLERKPNVVGTMWTGSKTRSLPSLKFVKFSYDAFIKLMKFNVQ